MIENEQNTQAEDITNDNDNSEQIDWKATALRYKKKYKEVKDAKKSDTKDTSDVDARFARLELKTDGYTDDAIDFILKYGGKEALENEHVKAAVQSIQEQKKAESAIVTSETQKSDVERKFSPEELSAMSAEELYKVLPKAKK